MNKILGVNLIRGMNGDDFMSEVVTTVKKHQDNGHVATVEYKPMLDKNGQMLYIAFVTVTE